MWHRAVAGGEEQHGLILPQIPRTDHLPRPVVPRPFRHPADTPAFANETRWRYALDPLTGRQVHEPRVPAPTYTLRCFVLTRLVKLFHAHARFNPALPAVTREQYRSLVQSLLRRDARFTSEESERLVFPGFANLRDFSRAFEDVLKAEAGGAWQSYFRRGHWRMILPFTRASQAREAIRLQCQVLAHRAPSVHVVTFPELTLNHSLILYSVTETERGLVFHSYDPNLPDESVPLTYDRSRRQFLLPALPYFIGGPINTYEVDCSFWR